MIRARVVASSTERVRESVGLTLQRPAIDHPLARTAPRRAFGLGGET
jgi:hypothetical protein